MLIPSEDHKAWREIITGSVKYDFECLAVKITLGRLNLTMMTDPSPAKLQSCASQLREVFVRNQQLPSIQNDLKQIFG